MRTKIGIGDIIVTLAAVLIAILFLLPHGFRDSGDEYTVLIKTDTEESVYELSTNRTVSVHSSGYDITVEIKDNAVRVADSSCPDRICVSSGWVRSPSRPIICAPAKVLIRIQSGGGDTDADCIAGR